MKYLNNELFEGTAVAAGPKIVKFSMNFNRHLNAYLTRGLVYMHLFRSLASSGETLMAALTTESRTDSFKLGVKKTGAGASFFKPDILRLAGFEDTGKYRMIVKSDQPSEVIFKICEADPQITTADPLITIHAPSLTKRTDAIALRKLQAKETAPEYLRYCAEVELETDRQERTHGGLFGNSHLARLPGMTRDHVHSKKGSFLLGIPPVVVGHYTNINWLTKPDNCSKGSRCDKTSTELLDDYFFAMGMKGSEITAFCKKYGLLFYIQ